MAAQPPSPAPWLPSPAAPRPQTPPSSRLSGPNELSHDASGHNASGHDESVHQSQTRPPHPPTCSPTRSRNPATMYMDTTTIPKMIVVSTQMATSPPSWRSHCHRGNHSFFGEIPLPPRQPFLLRGNPIATEAAIPPLWRSHCHRGNCHTDRNPEDDRGFCTNCSHFHQSFLRKDPEVDLDCNSCIEQPPSIYPSRIRIPKLILIVIPASSNRLPSILLA